MQLTGAFGGESLTIIVARHLKKLTIDIKLHYPFSSPHLPTTIETGDTVTKQC